MRTAVHPCPFCECGWERVKVNPAAPFYELVLLIDRISHVRRTQRAARS